MRTKYLTCPRLLHIMIMDLTINHINHTTSEKKINQQMAKEAVILRNGKKPTRKQKIRLGQAGLAPENWLVVKQKPNGELVILHKHTNKIRVVPPLAG